MAGSELSLSLALAADGEPRCSIGVAVPFVSDLPTEGELSDAPEETLAAAEMRAAVGRLIPELGPDPDASMEELAAAPIPPGGCDPGSPACAAAPPVDETALLNIETELMILFSQEGDAEAVVPFDSGLPDETELSDAPTTPERRAAADGLNPEFNPDSEASIDEVASEPMPPTGCEPDSPACAAVLPADGATFLDIERGPMIFCSQEGKAEVEPEGFASGDSAATEL